MPSEFHNFGNLPGELRLGIWKYALRPIGPTRPGAHFFSMTNHKEDGDALKKLRVQCELGSDCETEHGYRHCLAAPRYTSEEGSTYSWTSNNPSAYLWDFGMWGACRESREVIEEHYKMEHWKEKLRQYCLSNRRTGPPVDTCVPFLFERGGEDWRFAIHPNRDLVCIQPLDPNTIGRYRESIFLTEDICMVSWDVGLLGFRNLAFEYDSSWSDTLDQDMSRWDLDDLLGEKSSRGLFIRALILIEDGSLHWDDSLLLIDYNQEPDAENATSRKGTIFYGNDRNFVEVDSTPSYKYVSDKDNSALGFLNIISSTEYLAA
ncbi:hypothetical protein TARUN_9870 [Trichoderma arundinaceum]|uniref:2EXR domain-containing protein n=1 Tax=Trichoderma arundinaceum TaxID=490622 RepID=A0A395N8D4_TRIAR|nr:hypothetical protein TARUN_9870 [Trichoderma arundinaceum]